MLIPLYTRFSLVVLLSVVFLSPVGARQQKSSNSTQIGPFKISSWITVKTRRAVKGGWSGKIIGTPTRLIEMSSSQYDISAQNIELSTNSKNRPTDVTAIGKVKLVIRNKVTGDRTVANCEKAVFTSTGEPDDKGKIRLLGGVHAETFTKNFVGPLVLNGDSGLIEFLPNGDLDTTIHSESGNGSISGQPVETESKGKP